MASLTPPLPNKLKINAPATYCINLTITSDTLWWSKWQTNNCCMTQITVASHPPSSKTGLITWSASVKKKIPDPLIPSPQLIPGRAQLITIKEVRSGYPKAKQLAQMRSQLNSEKCVASKVLDYLPHTYSNNTNDKPLKSGWWTNLLRHTTNNFKWVS